MVLQQKICHVFPRASEYWKTLKYNFRKNQSPGNTDCAWTTELTYSSREFLIINS